MLREGEVAEDHYSPGEIRFTRKQALWLIRHLATLRNGHWPPEASSYIDIQGRTAAGNKAPFTTPVEYAAEIESRLEQCGTDGLVLEAIEGWGKSEASLANYLRKPEWVIRRRAKRALRYVASGPARRWHSTKKRKAKTYKEFIGQETKT